MWIYCLTGRNFFAEEREDGLLLLEGEETDAESIVEKVRKELDWLGSFMEIGRGSIAVEETEDIDWINNWKQYFHQFTIDDLLVLPSWEKAGAEDQDKKVLHIDPGTAFGTGMHETTQICIRQLKKFITEDTRLLDVGTGSGILSIVSLLYGIREAKGTDLDPCAVDAVEDNRKANGISPEQFELIIGNVITDRAVQDRLGYGCYDIAVANILADVLVLLAPAVASHVKPGGIYIMSGILAGQEEAVTEAVEAAGFRVLEITGQGEWVGITARKD